MRSMPGVDRADAVAGLEQRIEQVVVVHAWQRVDGLDPMRDESADRKPSKLA